jgi:hypothetical protein
MPVKKKNEKNKFFEVTATETIISTHRYGRLNQ